MFTDTASHEYLHAANLIVVDWIYGVHNRPYCLAVDVVVNGDRSTTATSYTVREATLRMTLRSRSHGWFERPMEGYSVVLGGRLSGLGHPAYIQRFAITPRLDITPTTNVG